MPYYIILHQNVVDSVTPKPVVTGVPFPSLSLSLKLVTTHLLASVQNLAFNFTPQFNCQ